VKNRSPSKFSHSGGSICCFTCLIAPAHQSWLVVSRVVVMLRSLPGQAE